MSTQAANNTIPILRSQSSTSLTEEVVSELRRFGLGDEDIRVIRELTADLETPVAEIGSVTDYVGGSPHVDITRFVKILNDNPLRTGGESFKEYCTRLIEEFAPKRASLLTVIAGRLPPSSTESDLSIRSLKNLLFACGFLAMSADDKTQLRRWVAMCFEFMKENPQYNVEGVYKWPEVAVPCPIAIGESAARNYLGYIDTPRFKANVGFMRAMFRHQRAAIEGERPAIAPANPTTNPTRR